MDHSFAESVERLTQKKALRRMLSAGLQHLVSYPLQDIYDNNSELVLRIGNFQLDLDSDDFYCILT